MRDDVPVRVTDEAARVVYPDAAEDERHSVPERVCVDAETDAEAAARSSPRR